MKVLGIHATGKEAADKITATGFRPGRSLANYLGEGAYFYLVHGHRGYQNATESAESVARRNHRNIAFLLADICIDNALNLQNPVIRPLFATFGAAFDRRVARLGLHVEPNDNASYYRPVSHLTIEAFRRSMEAVGGRPFDVLSARFALKGRDIDVELPPELCVKRSRALVSIKPCLPIDPDFLQSSDPASWPCADGTIKAAEQAGHLIAAIDDRDLFDLISSIYQGSDGYWQDRQPRFAKSGPVRLLYDSRQLEAAAEIASVILAEAPAIQPSNLARIASARTPPAQEVLDRLVEKTGGVVALFAPQQAEMAALLITLAERRPEVPILALLKASANSDAVDSKVPIMMRSRHNLCCLTVPRPQLLRELVRGFMHDRWTDGVALLDIEREMAARHGSTEMRHRDARTIVEAYHARQPVLL